METETIEWMRVVDGELLVEDRYRKNLINEWQAVEELRDLYRKVTISMAEQMRKLEKWARNAESDNAEKESE